MKRERLDQTLPLADKDSQETGGEQTSFNVTESTIFMAGNENLVHTVLGLNEETPEEIQGAEEAILHAISEDYQALGDNPTKEAIEEKIAEYTAHANYLISESKGYESAVAKNIVSQLMIVINTVLKESLRELEGKEPQVAENSEQDISIPTPEITPTPKKGKVGKPANKPLQKTIPPGNFETTRNRVEQFNTFDEVQNFLLTEFDTPAVQVGKENGPAILEVIEQILIEKLSAAQKESKLALKFARSEIMRLEKNLDTHYVFHGAYGEPGAKIGETLTNQPNKADKAILLKKLYVVFTRLFREADAKIDKEEETEIKTTQPKTDNRDQKDKKNVPNPEVQTKEIKEIIDAVNEFIVTDEDQLEELSTMEVLKMFTAKVNKIAKTIQKHKNIIGSQKIPKLASLKLELEARIVQMQKGIEHLDGEEDFTNLQMRLVSLKESMENILEEMDTKKPKQNTKTPIQENLENTIINKDSLKKFFAESLVAERLTKTQVNNLTVQIGAFLGNTIDQLRGQARELQDFEKYIYECENILNKNFGFNLKSFDTVGNKLPANQENKKDFLSRMWNSLNFALAEAKTAKNAKKPKVASSAGNSHKEAVASLNKIEDISNVFAAIKDLSEDPMDILNLEKKIALLLINEFSGFEKMKDESVKKLEAKILTLKAETLTKQLSGLDLDEATMETKEFVTRVTENIKDFVEKIQNELSGKKESAPSKNEASPEENLAPEAPQETPADYILIGNMVRESIEGTHASSEILNDEGFNAWLLRMAKLNHKKEHGFHETLEVWHELYTSQQQTLSKVKELVLDKKMYTEIFDSYGTESDKAFARHKKVEELEWGMLANQTETEATVQHILAQRELCIKQAETITRMEKKKLDIEKAFKNTGLKIPEELVFDMIHGPKADMEKMRAFHEFMNDMENNYLYYHGGAYEGETDGEKEETIRQMEMLYKKTHERAKEKGETVGKIGMFQAWGNKIAKMWKPIPRKQGDLVGFLENIRVLQELGLVPTEKTDGNTAKENMQEFKKSVGRVVTALTEENIPTVTELLSEPVLVDKYNLHTFKKMYETYIKNQSNHSSMQEKARKLGEMNVVLEREQTQLDDQKRLLKDSETFELESVRGENYEDFVKEVKRDSLDKELSALQNELKRNTKNITVLKQIASKLAALDMKDATDALHLLHQKLSLLLMEAYSKVAIQSAEAIAPGSVLYYKKIFASPDNQITREQKLAFARSGKTVIAKARDKQPNPLKQHQLNQVVIFFTEKEAELALPA